MSKELNLAAQNAYNVLVGLINALVDTEYGREKMIEYLDFLVEALLDE